jgi:integrase/ribosomal protein L40E
MAKPDKYNIVKELRRPLLDLDQLLDKRKKKYKLDDETIELFRKFDQFAETRGISPRRRKHYLYYMPKLAELLKPKTFTDAIKEDYETLIRKFDKLPEYHKRTKIDFKVCLKTFVKWLKGHGDDNYMPPEVSWISSVIKHRQLKPEDILTEDEIKRIFKVLKTPRDKAFVNVCWEVGFRSSEIMNLKVGDVVFEKDGCRLSVDGKNTRMNNDEKVGERSILLIASAPALASYLEYHPYREDPKAPLWIMSRIRKVEQENEQGKMEITQQVKMTYDAARKMLHQAFEAAGIKKDATIYELRHSAATRLSSKLTEFQLKKFMGWKMDSAMPQVYISMSGRDLDSSIRQMNGLSTEVEKSKLIVKVCMRCHFKNSPDRERCEQCTAPLDLSVAMKQQEQATESLRKLARNEFAQMAKEESIKIMREYLEKTNAEKK